MGLTRRTPSAEATTTEPPPLQDPVPVAELTVDDLMVADAEERRAAVLALWGEPGAVPVLLEALDVERDPVVRDALLTVLTGHDDPRVGRRLTADLRSEDVAVRNGAVRALQAMPGAVATLVEEGLLEDDDQDVRVLAVMVLSTVEHPSVPTWLLQVVEEDTGATVVAAAVDAAVTLGGSAGATCAARAVQRFPDDPYLQFLVSLAESS